MALSDLITSLRLLADDGPDSKVIFDENLGSNPALPIDGTNRNFRLQNIPVVTGTVYLTITGIGGGNAFRSQAGFTLTNADNGILTFSSAPDAAKTITADYNYLYFSDEKYTEFLEKASENLQLNQTPADATTVPNGLVPALMQYALGYFFLARYAQYASRYASSGGQAGQSVQVVGQEYKDAAMKCFNYGKDLRDQFYTRQSQSLSPAYAGTTASGGIISVSVDPITPPR